MYYSSTFFFKISDWAKTQSLPACFWVVTSSRTKVADATAIFSHDSALDYFSSSMMALKSILKVLLENKHSCATWVSQQKQLRTLPTAPAAHTEKWWTISSRLWWVQDSFASAPLHCLSIRSGNVVKNGRHGSHRIMKLNFEKQMIC